MKTWKTSTFTYLVAVIVIFAGVMSQESQQAWEKPGCYLVGNTRRISIPGCVEFDIQTNACRGFCESYSVPSPFEILKNNQKHTVSSFADCCTIDKTEETRVRVWCKDGMRHLVFRSATNCTCYRCKRT